MTRTLIDIIAVLGVVGQVLAAVVVVAALVALAGVRAPLATIRGALWGYELWGAFVVSALSMGGSLFFSEDAHFVPCELCWYQRICMYPIVLIVLLAAIRGDFGVARYLVPLTVIGAGISVYHLLVENGAVDQTSACQLSAPGGCATKWIDKFGWVTIPTLSLTAFVLTAVFLALATFGGSTDAAREDRGTLDTDAKR